MTKLVGETRSRYEVKARLVKALAHPTRLFMVDELAGGERCVCELRDLVGADIVEYNPRALAVSSAAAMRSGRSPKNLIPCAPISAISATHARA